MSTEERKYKIIEKILEIEDSEMLYSIEKVLDNEALHPLLIQLLDKSSAAAKKKKGKPHSEVMAGFKKKFLPQNDV